MPLFQGNSQTNRDVSPVPAPEVTEGSLQRAYYRQVIEEGLHLLFEQRATACPMCSAQDLVRELTLQDYVLLKPGYFHMSRCQRCGHIFQNPRLNTRGLEFYYRDFYTGAGEATVQHHLASMSGYYQARARMIRGHHKPRRWLDVGAGYGHFSQAAAGLWKETKFHVIDVSESIKRAEDSGWAERAYIGTFLDVVPQLGETYDVVSMFHYLEHTPDPLAELRAAAAIVEPGGFLMIEVPDPDSVGRQLMGRWWPSWFSPQHLHFFPSRNMGTYLRNVGFEPILWHRAQAHQATDALFAMGNYMQKLLSPPNLPWSIIRKQAPISRLLTIKLMWFPLRLMMRVLDLLLSPLRYLPRWPNTYRVLAQKRDSLTKTSAS